MRLLLLLTLIGSGALAEEKSAEFKVNCRKAIHGTFHVDEFDDWNIVTNDVISTLDGVSIVQRSAGQPKTVVPDDFQSKGARSGTLKLKDGENWLVCHHSKLKMVIERRIPDGLKTCILSELPDAVAVVCR